VRVGLVIAGVSAFVKRARLFVIGVGILEMSSGLIAVSVVGDEMRVRLLAASVEILEMRRRLIETAARESRLPTWGFGAIAMNVGATALRAAAGMMTARPTTTRPCIRSTRTRLVAAGVRSATIGTRPSSAGVRSATVGTRPSTARVRSTTVTGGANSA
jgi:hypothetical protein